MLIGNYDNYYHNYDVMFYCFYKHSHFFFILNISNKIAVINNWYYQRLFLTVSTVQMITS